MEIVDIVRKLIGPVTPTGQHGVDVERRKNLDELTTLVDKLLFDINSLVPFANRPEASMKAIGQDAAAFMEGIEEQ